MTRSYEQLEQNLRDANRITAGELKPGDIIVLGHWFGFVGRLTFLVLSVEFVLDQIKPPRSVVCCELLSGGSTYERLFESDQWIEAHR